MGGRKKTFKALKKPKLYKPKSNFDCGVCGWKDCILIKMYIYINIIFIINFILTLINYLFYLIFY